jgi:hypothetical protein
MHTTASVPADQFRDLLKRLPAGLDLDRLALETKAIQRKRKIGDGASLLRLALARGPGRFSLRQTSAWVSLLESADLSNPGVHYRLKQAVAFLAALIGHLLAAKAPGANLRWAGRVLRLADGTCVSKPGSKGTDWRVHGVFDLGSGGFSHLELTDKHGAEALERGPPAGGGDPHRRPQLCPGAGFEAISGRRRRQGRLYRAGRLECAATDYPERQSLRSDWLFTTPPRRHEAA